MVALVGLSIRILIVFPVRESGRALFMHGSPAAGIGVNVAPRVGMTGNVAVKSGVFVAVAVGGGGVAVGMAA